MITARFACLAVVSILVATAPNSVAQTQTFPGPGLYSGVYFGTGENGEGHWAMCIYWDGQPVFDFIGRPRDDASLIRSYLYTAEVYDDGRFEGEALPIPSAAQRRNIAGDIDRGRVKGVADNWRFVGEIDRSEGATSIFAGLWGSAFTSPYSVVEAIVGPSGKALVAYRTSPTTGEAALTRVDANGQFVITLSGGTRVSGRVDLGTRRLIVAFGGEPSPSVPASQAQLSNFSLLSSLTPAGAQIVQQFSLRGEQNKNLLLRAVSTPLELFRPGSYLTNPALEVWNSDGVKVAANDDWMSNDAALRNAIQRVGALPLPAASPDAAQLIALPPGDYTLIVRSSEPGATGAVLTEIFDLEPDKGQLTQLTSRGRVEPDDPLISGFVISGDKPALVLVRAIGPRLADFGVSGALADPQLKITASNGITVAQNDDWNPSDVALVSAMREAGGILLHAPSKDAAMLVALPPGAYGASVRGANGASGLAQIEITQPHLSRASDAGLAVELFKVQMTRFGDHCNYEPQLWVYGNDAGTTLTLRAARFRLIGGGGERIPEWRTAKPVAPGSVTDVIPLVYGDPEFSFSSSSAEASHVSVTLIFTGRDLIERSITALTQVAKR